MVDRHQLGAVGKSAFDLHLADHAGHTRHDLVAAEKFSSQAHQFGHRFSVTYKFQQLRGDQGNGFGMIQAPAAGQSFLGQNARLMQQQFVNFARGEVHLFSVGGGHRVQLANPRVIVQQAADESKRLIDEPRHVLEVFTGRAQQHTATHGAG